MNLARFWKRTHTLLQSTYTDEVDDVIAGRIFKVKYLGRVDVDENQECNFSQTAQAIFKQYSKKCLDSVVTLDLSVDAKCVELRDNFGEEPKILLAIPLTDIRDALYRNKDKTLKNVFIFVARDKPSCPILKAHILVCENPGITRNIFNTFQSAFSLCQASVKNNSPSRFLGTQTEITDYNSYVDQSIGAFMDNGNNNTISHGNTCFKTEELGLRKNDDAFQKFVHSRV